MKHAWLDARYGLRTIRRNPGSAALIILTLALGIGGSTAIFSFVRGILLRPLPYAGSERLIMVCETHPDRSQDWCGASPGNLAEWARASRTIDAMGLARSWPFAIRRDGKHEGVEGGVVTSGLFPVFGVSPERGRLFRPEDSETGQERVAVVSHGFWQSRLGGASDVVGQRVLLDDEVRTIIGVLPPGFEVPYLGDVQLWIPIWPERKDNHEWRGFSSFARLAPGATLEQAQSEMEAIRASIEPRYPDANRGWGVTVDSLRDRTVRSVRPALMVFLGAVGFVLLIACANVANLLLAQATSRGREFAVRAALGAAPGRLIHQLLTESAALALAGGALGWIVASWATDLLLALAPGDIPRLGEVRMDGWVLAFSLLLSAAASVLFGLAPAWHAGRAAPHDALKEGRYTGEKRGSVRTRNLLVAAEVGLSLVLLIGAGLLLRSFVHLLDWSPGFDRRNLLAVQVFTSPGKYPKAAQAADLFARATEELRSIPGVVSAAEGSAVPLRGGDGSQEFWIEGRPVPPPGERPAVLWFDVGPGYFSTLGIPVVKGREITEADGPSAPPVAVINETMARRYWPGEDPIGKRLTLAVHKMTVEIVGVVGDVQPFRSDRQPEPEVYWPHRQVPRYAIMFVVRTASPPAAMTASVRSRLEAIDPEMDIGRSFTMDELVDRELVRPRFDMLLVGLFALTALALAMVGVYGVIAYSVEQRTHEIGVRLSMGAQRSDVLRLIVAGGMKWTLAGVVLGEACAVPLTLMLRRLLVGVSPSDPWTFAAAALVLAATAFLASYLPASRSTRIDPMSALRSE
jgi:putative ABC transport system permease protein